MSYENQHMEDLELYEDEPMTSVRASGFSGNQMVIENMDDVERKRQKRRRKRRKRLERLGKIAVAVCCLGAILAIVLTVMLTEAAIAATSPAPPTVAPTPMPVIQTYKPTIAHPTAKVPEPTTKPPSMSVPTVKPAAPTTPAPTFAVNDTYTMIAQQDTYIYTMGAEVSKTYGRQDTLYVKAGRIGAIDATPDAIALLVFDTTAIPSFDKLASTGRSATLKLYHQPLDLSDRDRGPASITVSRMQKTPLLIESVSGSDFEVPQTVDGPTIDVPVDSAEVSFDITDLFFSSEFNSQDQLFLKLQAYSQDQEVGDYFFSRESDTPPQLLLAGLAP